MTLTTDAQTLFTKHGLDRKDALVAAKTLGQMIIEEVTGEAPLEGIVYEVWGLYNDGMPACRFESTGAGDEVEFVGTFRTKGGAFVKRHRTVPMDEIETMAEQPTPPKMPA
jgi:hypothetical protein